MQRFSHFSVSTSSLPAKLIKQNMHKNTHTQNKKGKVRKRVQKGQQAADEEENQDMIGWARKNTSEKKNDEDEEEEDDDTFFCFFLCGEEFFCRILWSFFVWDATETC